MANNRDDFNQDTIRIMAERVGLRCSNPRCRQETSGPNCNSNKRTSIGIAAHICAAAPGGPRYNENMTPQERKSIENGIWLCSNCATIIDKNPEEYSYELLHKWKADAEYEQMCRLTNIANLKSIQNKEALRILSNDIQQLHDQVKWYQQYYDMKFSSCTNFVEVWNQIEKYYMLHKPSLGATLQKFQDLQFDIKNHVMNYKLDISKELYSIITEYCQLLSFRFDVDAFGFEGYTNYYEKLFEKVITDKEALNELYNKIIEMIDNEYRQ